MNPLRTVLISKHSIVTYLGTSSIFLSFFNQLLVPLKIDRIQPYIAFGVVLTGLLSLVFWINSNGLSRLDKKTKTLFKWWVVCLVVMIALPIFYYHTFDFSNAYFGRGLTQDYLYAIYITLAFIFVDPYREVDADVLFLRVSQLALITGLIAILISDVSAINISERSNAWTLQYHLWWIACAIFPYCFYYSFIVKKNKFLGYSVFLVYTIFGLIVLKRAVIVNFLVIILTAFWLVQRPEFGSRSKRFSAAAKVLIAIILIITLSYLLMPYISTSLHERFTFLFKNLNEWDRRLEANEYFKNASLNNIILGNGLNNYFVIELKGRDFQINALHVGFLNMIYKGGIFLLLFTLIIFKNIYKMARCSPLPPEGLIAVGIGISFIVSLGYEMSFGYPPIIFFYLVPILRGFKYINR